MNGDETGGPKGLILVGHGTRDARGVSEFLTLADLVAERLPEVVVRPGFLELAEPTIPEAIAEIVSRGVETMVSVPVLLFAAGHAKQDIPQAVQRTLKKYPQVRHRQASHLGADPSLVTLSADRYQQATANLPSLTADETILVLVGRGSRDSDATAEMLEFSRLRQQDGELPHVTTAFYAIAQPSLDATVKKLQQSSFRRIVVQPHLLFTGQIMEQIRELVRQNQRESFDREWVVCEHLGASHGLAAIVVERYMQVVSR